MTRDEWLYRRTYRGADVDPEQLVARKGATTVSVVLPALNVEVTVGAICDAIRRHWMTPGGLVDELVVIDSSSTDATARVAKEHGATVHQDRDILPSAGPGSGKGNAMWKSLAATTGDIVIWIDSDIEDFDPRFVPGLLAPLLLTDDIQFVKAHYRRPLGLADDGGGRVTEICARPLLNRYYPDLTGFVQPLAGEAAGRRNLLENIPFLTGYAVEIGHLIDIHRAAGLGAMAQTDLGERRHHNQPTPTLGRMAYEITHAVLARSSGGPVTGNSLPEYHRPIPSPDGYTWERTPVSIAERPPLATLAELGARG